MPESVKKPKPKKPGRPRMAKAVAKGSIMPVRFSPEDRKRIEAAAKASKQTVSAWIRSTLTTALEA
jgi:predicted HicB family RNase H-like nuclease